MAWLCACLNVKLDERLLQQNDIDILAKKIREGHRASLARGITLIESRKAIHRQQATSLIQELIAYTGKSLRIGVSGVPGAGKSTTINNFGTWLVNQGHKVAVLAVDPSSIRTGGSILGDKTRMQDLAQNPHAYIRPSPASGTLGGVAAKTRETMLLCEAAGFDIILIETVGTGQSEIAVADMVDCFLVLMLAGAGDDLQGIKKGILEIADIIAINKCDGDNIVKAKQAATEYRGALGLLASQNTDWVPPVLTISGLEGNMLDDLWQHVSKFREKMQTTGRFTKRRQTQQLAWMWEMVNTYWREGTFLEPQYRMKIEKLEQKVKEGMLSPSIAADKCIKILTGNIDILRK